MTQIRQPKPKPLKDFPVTTLLIISFVFIFSWQVMTGVDADNPSNLDLLNWGANTLALSVTNQPWRLLTAGFLHIGLMHLMFNCFAIYFFGQVAEKMWGSLRFLVLFLLSVISGNLLNSYVSWQGLIENNITPNISAGASGGIMGIGAALLIFALFKIRVAGIQLNFVSLLMIMGINLAYGFVGGANIDNAGHIGGVITGAILAFVYVFAWKLKPIIQSILFYLTVGIILTALFWIWNHLHTLIMPYLR